MIKSIVKTVGWIVLSVLAFIGLCYVALFIYYYPVIDRLYIRPCYYYPSAFSDCH